MNGSQKLKPLLIVKSLKPRCSHGVKFFPVDCQASEKAWITAEIFKGFLKNLNRKMKSEKRKILLFLDNCAAHPDIDLNCVKLQFFPPNTTSKLQPMDQGIIKNAKRRYRKKVMMRYLDDIDKG